MGDYVEQVLDISSDGFSSELYDVIDAQIRIRLADDYQVIYPNDPQFDHPLLDSTESAVVQVDGATFFTGELNSPETYSYVLPASTVAADGRVNFRISPVGSVDFVFDWAELSVTAAKISAVSEPGAVWLFIPGILALFGLNKWKRILAYPDFALD